MSEFTKDVAEAAGWAFVHIEDGAHRAEKYVAMPGRTSKLINEFAETAELLLTRVEAYEKHLEKLFASPDAQAGEPAPEPPVEEPAPVEEPVAPAVPPVEAPPAPVEPPVAEPTPDPVAEDAPPVAPVQIESVNDAPPAEAPEA